MDGDSSTRIKKNESGNITITSRYRDSFCSMEYDSTGSFVSSWSGTILTSIDGDSWTSKNSETSYDLNGVSFIE